jgi:hypothetical protein
MEVENISFFKKSILSGIIIILVCILSIFLYLYYKNSAHKKEAEAGIEVKVLTNIEPIKREFGTSTPEGFPVDIPIEKDAKVTQSYSLDYTGQKQLTFVFESKKTVKENYTLYKDFLKKTWGIVNDTTSSTTASLYVVKENNDMNLSFTGITATGTKMHSLVSISFLKK